MTDEGSIICLVGSYGASSVPTIRAFGLDEATGTLTPIGSHSGVGDASFLLVAEPDVLLATSEGPGAVVGLRMRRIDADLRLDQVSVLPSMGDAPCHLAIHGPWVVAANYGSGSLSVLRRGPGGRLLEVSAVATHRGSGPRGDRQEGPHVHGSCFLDDGRWLVAADLGIDRLVVYRFDPERGRVDRHEEVATAAGSGPRQLVAHPDGRHVLVVNELDNTVATHRWVGDGSLPVVDAIPTVPDDAPSNLAADIRIAGQLVYVANRGHDSVAVLSVDRDGRLSRLGSHPTGGSGPRGFSLSPSGAWLVAANQAGNSVTVLPVREGGTTLGDPVTEVTVPSPASVVFSRGSAEAG
ncbi:MAG: lactonase family protein [Acidimicrobiia bacterium]